MFSCINICWVTAEFECLNMRPYACIVVYSVFYDFVIEELILFYSQIMLRIHQLHIHFTCISILTSKNESFFFFFFVTSYYS